LKILALIYNGNMNDTSNRADLYRVERLNSLGVIGLAPKSIVIGTGHSRQDSYITLNKIGKMYSDIIFN